MHISHCLFKYCTPDGERLGVVKPEREGVAHVWLILRALEMFLGLWILPTSLCSESGGTTVQQRAQSWIRKRAWDINWSAWKPDSLP